MLHTSLEQAWGDEKLIHNSALKPEGKRSVGRTTHICENIKMIVTERGSEDADWIHLIQDRNQCRIF
jgi:hypothetical protein